MSRLQEVCSGLRVAQTTLEKAMASEELDEMKVLAIQAVNEILESSQPKPVTVQRDYCPNSGCGRLITERDPIFAGYCSTICREANRQRVRKSVHEKFGQVLTEGL